MIPHIDHPVWVQIVTGERPIKSCKATINMLIQSNKMSYERDASLANTKELIAKTHKFFTQFESIFASEIAQIVS
jgi:hypothetical protein